MTTHLTAVVGDAAASAERMALLVELTEWHFAQAQPQSQVKDAAPALLAEWHLGQAARLARELAEQERRRCAANHRKGSPSVSGGTEARDAP